MCKYLLETHVTQDCCTVVLLCLVSAAADALLLAGCYCDCSIICSRHSYLAEEKKVTKGDPSPTY